MDEKYPRITPTSTFTSTSLAGWNTPDIQRSMLDRRDRRKRQWLLLFVSAVLASLLLWRSYSRLRLRLSALRQPETISIIDSNSKAVPLEAHIMSKCPDSKDCLHDLVLPAMQRIYDKVDFKLSYIGTYVLCHTYKPHQPIQSPHCDKDRISNPHPNTMHQP